ncbi:glycoside hydrolase family 17 protein [Patellaria atrata CBS 101060]|uniref:glucan 1,3-beta-glucosidase n=1 Tax=Patellaria atrata CBS 101060 TaxID=1346257 RepID=A0A9P4VVW8_9PEZI|nr:glycoside hydrolase family 17 protein [Patellaria atrata CBS 101060]
MYLTAIVSLAIALAPAVVSAKGKVGFALGTKMPNGECKFQPDYEADFDTILAASGSKLVRGYAASDCDAAKWILPAAKKKGFQVMLGVWPDTPESFALDKKALTTYVPQYKEQVYGITVGSESLYRGNFTDLELLDKIQDIKQALPYAKVGTADSWNVIRDGKADAIIRAGVDLMLVNAFAFWQGATIENATAVYFDDLMQAFGHIQTVAGGVDSAPELWNGETGWPTTGGTNFKAAEAGTENAKHFYQKGFCAAIDWNVNSFYFEAFDEPWKPLSVGDDGFSADETHWGAMTADRNSKFSLKC